MTSKVSVWLLLTAISVAAQADGPYYRPSVVVQIGVSDLTKSMAFYEQMLGFKPSNGVTTCSLRMLKPTSRGCSLA